jgi:hypothetical protein
MALETSSATIGHCNLAAPISLRKPRATMQWLALAAAIVR